MPSPFPGMDPYLEGNLWSGFHHEIATAIKFQLAPKLLPRYYAFVGRYMLPGNPNPSGVGARKRPFYPDVGVSRHDVEAPPSSAQVLAAPLKMHTVLLIPIPHVRVVIRDIEERAMVAAIELLSPTKKQGRGRTKYLRKRRKVIESTAHLIEIDLLRKGRRLPMTEPYPPAPYFACIGRAEVRPETDVWPIALDQRLPALPVPLLGGEQVELDLQAAFDFAYDHGQYRAFIDYRKPPDVPLPAKQATWADGLLQENKLRS